MKVYTRCVLDMSTWEVLEEDSFEYEGKVSLAGGGGGGETTTNTISEPPAWQQPFMEQYLNAAQGLYNAQPNGPQQYPNSRVADWNPNLQGGVVATQNAANSLGAGAQNSGVLANQAAGGINSLMQAQNPMTNPFFAGTAEAMIRPATQAMTQQILPGIQDQFTRAGQFGGSRQGVAEGIAVDRYQQNVLDTLNRFGTSAYGQGLDSLGRGVALAPQAQAMQGVPGQMLGQAGSMLGQAGQQQQQYQQRLIDAAGGRFDTQRQQPYDTLNWYAKLVGNPLGSNTQSIAPGQKTGGIPGAIGGAAAAGAVAPWLAPALGMPAAWPIIAGGALLGGLF